jgi:hypothetical protein
LVLAVQAGQALVHQLWQLRELTAVILSLEQLHPLVAEVVDVVSLFIQHL